MAEKFAPVPYLAPLTDSKTGKGTPVWLDWFRALSGWTTSFSTSGYQALPSGLIIQWGVTESLSSGSSNTTTFPVAFPNACLQVITGLRDMSGSSTSDTGHYGTGNYTTTTFDIYNRTASDYAFNWFAVGY